MDEHPFEIDDTYLFKHYFEGEDVFDRLKRYYNNQQYRFEVPPDDFEELREFLDEHGYGLVVVDVIEEYVVVVRKYTLGVLNDAGVLTIVDAVSSLGDTPVPVDEIDLCLGASQKCFSSPPGLTTISVSDDAWAKIDSTTQDTFYTSLAPWHDIEPIEEDPTALPYTHLISNLYALKASLDRMLDEGVDAVYDSASGSVTKSSPSTS